MRGENIASKWGVRCPDPCKNWALHEELKMSPAILFFFFFFFFEISMEKLTVYNFVQKIKTSNQIWPTFRWNFLCSFCQRLLSTFSPPWYERVKMTERSSRGGGSVLLVSSVLVCGTATGSYRFFVGFFFCCFITRWTMHLILWRPIVSFWTITSV